MNFAQLSLAKLSFENLSLANLAMSGTKLRGDQAKRAAGKLKERPSLKGGQTKGDHTNRVPS